MTHSRRLWVTSMKELSKSETSVAGGGETELKTMFRCSLRVTRVWGSMPVVPNRGTNPPELLHNIHGDTVQLSSNNYVYFSCS